MKRSISIMVTVLLCLTLIAQWQQPSRTGMFNAGSVNAATIQGVQCPPLPTDVTAKLSQGYGRGIDPKDQRPFDEFSWQSFVALNCPATGPTSKLRGQYDNIPRVWETYLNAEDLFLPNQQNMACAPGVDSAGAKVLRRIAKNAHIKSALLNRPVPSILEAVGGPLIDRNQNFTLYEIHLNPDEVKYIKANNLQTLGGQFAFKQSGKKINFPAGPTPQFGAEGAIEVKASWRILDVSKGDKPERFYTRQALIYVDGADTKNGQPLCFPAVIGLVGLHIIHKTKNFTRWIWSTFEHVDNVPSAVAHSPYSYNSPGCVTNDCYPPNTPPKSPNGKFQWAASAPYARGYGSDSTDGTQVVRSVPIYGETDEVNKTWRAKVGGVWANYHLIGSQWSVELDEPNPQPVIALPNVLANTTLETYIQTKASCINCHNDFATTAYKQKADFSFVLGMIPLLKSRPAVKK